MDTSVLNSTVSCVDRMGNMAMDIGWSPDVDGGTQRAERLLSREDLVHGYQYRGWMVG